MRLISRRSARAATLTFAAALAMPLAAGVPTEPAYARGAPDSFADLATKLLPAVVNISSTQAAQARAGGPGAGPEIPMFPPGSPFEQFFKDFLNRNRPGAPGGRVVMGGIAWSRLATIEMAATSAARDSIPGLDLSNEIAGNLIMAYALTVEQLGQGDILATQKLAARWQANQEKFEASIRKYESTIRTAEDRELFAAFKSQVVPYARFQHDILQLNSDLKYKEVNEMWRDRLDPALEKAGEAIQATVNFNKAAADYSVKEISGAVVSAKFRILASFMATLVFTCIGAYYLLRGISRPLQQLNDIA
jgi:hypothetical protein